MNEFLDSIIDFFKTQFLYILLGILVLIIGLFIIKIIKKIITKSYRKRNKDGSQLSFILSILDLLLKIVVLIISLSVMNFNTTSLIAVVSTCGVAIGLALKDSLSNIASGIIIIYNKPFKEGDYIDIDAVSGKVISINIFNTVLWTTDNKSVVIPNSTVVNNPVINYDSRPTRRVDFTFSVAYGSDMKKVSKVILEVIEKQNKILKDPSPFVRMSKQAFSAVEFSVKVWTMSNDYWDVYYDMIELVYDAFVNNNISIPFEQLDVHINKDE